MSFNRIPPETSMSAHAASMSTFSQDIIEHAAALFQLSYELDALARPAHDSPDGQLSRKGHLWEAQAKAVKDLYNMSLKIADIRNNVAKLTNGEFG